MAVAIKESNSTLNEARARRKLEKTQEILEDLTRDVKDGRRLSLLDRMAAVRRLVEEGRMLTYELLLPVLFTLKGKPYTLQDHFPFSPQFNCHLPAMSVWKAARQVSKSTSVSASGIALANAVPFRTLLYVCPLYEQIRRLSGNYVRAFIDQSPVRELWTGTTTENSVLQRSFRNNSKMIFSFALLDADRIRGIAADMVTIDESVRYGTMIETPSGVVPIESLEPGDQVHAVDDQGRVQLDEVITNSDHGIRDCYRIILSNGAMLDCTSDSFIATTAGWRRISTLIEELDRVSSSDAPGDNAGRREYRLSQSEPEVRQSTRSLPARIQYGEIPGVVRIRLETTREGEELRLRRMVESLVHEDLAGISPYRVLVSPRRQETGDANLARSADLGRCGLVVSGRWRPLRTDRQVQYARIYRGRSSPPGFLADAEWRRGQGSTGQQPATDELLLDRPIDRSVDAHPRGENPSLGRPVDALQGRPETQDDVPALFLVRSEVHTDARERDLFHSATTVLRIERLSTIAASRHLASSRGDRGEQVEPQRQGAGTIPLRYCSSAGTWEEVRRGETGTESAGHQRHESALPGEETHKEGRVDLDLRAVQTGRTERKSGCQDEVLRDVSHPGRPRDQGEICDEAEIIRIEWTGKHPVRDISTRHYRTFFANNICVHNCQDMDSDHLPIIRETMAVSDWKLQRFMGTPKTLDNTIEGLWRDSSMAEWFVPCWACGKMNIPSLEFDLERMLGPLRDDITPDNPATICANPRCGLPINPRYGRWVHRYENRRWEFSGYHVPQVLLPMHYGNRRAWGELLGKQRGAANTAPHVFINEVLGESSAMGNQLLTLDDVLRTAMLPWSNRPNDPDATMWDWLVDYPHKVLAIDWGGGGARKKTGMATSGAKIELNSYTTLALLGRRVDGQIHVLWGKRLLTPHEHVREAEECWYWGRRFRPNAVPHDYTGAGTVRETILVQAGVPISLIMPIAYVRSASASLMLYVPATPGHQRDHYNLDKTRSLLYMCTAFKLGLIKTFRDDYVDKDNPGLLRDLIALVDEKIESPHARDIYIIRKMEGFTDDFAQAINLGCAALWHMTEWPDFAQLAGLPTAQPLGEDQVRAAGNAATEWTDEDFMEPGFFWMP